MSLQASLKTLERLKQWAMNNLEILYGPIFGFTVGVNYINFDTANDGEYMHVLQMMFGIFLIEFSWISNSE